MHAVGKTKPRMEGRKPRDPAKIEFKKHELFVVNNARNQTRKFFINFYFKDGPFPASFLHFWVFYITIGRIFGIKNFANDGV